jgi:hypothetical protein
MKTKELIAEIENAYSRYFPNSKIFVNFSTNLYPSIYITCFLAKDKSENSGGYWDNDILNVRFMIGGENFREFSKDITLDSELSIITLENQSKNYHIKPDNKYMVYSGKDLSFRKVQGNADKILKSLKTFFEKMKLSLQDDLNNDKIHDHHVNLVINKLS